MASLPYLSPTTIVKPISASSLPNNSSPGHRLPPKNETISIPRVQSTPPRKPVKKQPSVAEVERAIGAGMFRDRDPMNTTEKPTMFDMIMNSAKEESPVEKKLRETGEWLLETTEGPNPSAGQGIFLAVCLWILPFWLFFLLITSGAVQLPFSIPVLDDLIM